MRHLFWLCVVVGCRLDTPQPDRDSDGAPDAADCGPSDPLIYPGAFEVPYDGIDQDCDGADLVDVDGDGVPGPDRDCDDENPDAFPGNNEPCDGIDNDCSGVIDDGRQNGLWYRDRDGDSFGTGDAILDCTGGDGLAVVGGDCNDLNADVYPGAPERCNRADDNCDGVVPDDEYDHDGDAYSVCHGDPDDTDPNINPDWDFSIADTGLDVALDGAFRGMEFESTGVGTLRTFAFYLDLPQDCQIDFYVHGRQELDEDHGTIWSASVLATAGSGLVTSPYIGIDKVPNYHYGLGIGFVCDATLRRDDSGWYRHDAGIGRYLQSYTDDGYVGYNRNYLPSSYGDTQSAWYMVVTLD